MRVLFICNQNENRSKTAEELFKEHHETKSAGLFSEKPVSQEQLEWAELIVVMEDRHRTELANRFPQLYLKKRIISCDIPDIYARGQDKLITELRQKISPLL